MKRISYFIISIATVISIFSFTGIVSNAEKLSTTDGLEINGEYKIADADGIHTRYVVLATNNSGQDIEVQATFNALSSTGSAVKTVSDYANAVNDGQTFIVYGQFKNSDIEEAADFSYDLDYTATSDCKYDSVNVDVKKGAESALTVTGTNYSSEDIACINVRTVFFKGGVPVAFDTVNLGDSGYSLRSGSSNTQELGQVPVDFDDYLVTYSAAGDM